MRIKVTGVEDKFVSFSCDAGYAVAICKEGNLILGAECDVELDIDDDIRLGVNSEKAETAAGSFQYKNDNNFINGVVEDMDEVACICFRIAIDCIIVCYVNDPEIRVGDGLQLSITKRDLQITLVGS